MNQLLVGILIGDLNADQSGNVLLQIESGKIKNFSVQESQQQVR